MTTTTAPPATAAPGTAPVPAAPGAPTAPAAVPSVSRAIGRLIEPGSDAGCAACGRPVRFAAKLALRQVIANVYVAGRWDRVEHFHDECYEQAGAPYGPADRSTPTRRRGG